MVSKELSECNLRDTSGVFIILKILGVETLKILFQKVLSSLKIQKMFYNFRNHF